MRRPLRRLSQSVCSREDAKNAKEMDWSHDLEDLARVVVDCGYKIHVDLGPGMLESVYEVILAAKLVAVGIEVERQKPIPINLKALRSLKASERIWLSGDR